MAKNFPPLSGKPSGSSSNAMDLEELEVGNDLGFNPTGAIEPETSIVTGSVGTGSAEASTEVEEEIINGAIDNFIDKTEKAFNVLEQETKGGSGTMVEGFGFGAPLMEEKVAAQETVKEVSPTLGGGDKGFFIPKKYKKDKEITKQVMKEVDKSKINILLEETLTGTGSSEISGNIDIHVKTADIEDAIKRVIRKVSEETVKINGVSTDMFEKFIAGIVGISSTLSYDMANMPLTAANYHREATAKILADNPNLQQAQASSKAAEIVSSYIGKNIEELKNAASSLPVKFLTLVVKRSAIPTVNGKDDKNAIDLITNCFTSEYVKSVIKDGDEFLHFAINMSRVFKYAQGHFKAKDLETLQLISATIMNNNASVNSVVYKVVKKAPGAK